MQNNGPRPSRTAGPESLTGPRRAVLDVLVGADTPVTVPVVAAALGLHTNTAREHLDALVRAGLVSRETAPPRGRGRPSALYRPTADAALGGREYAVLAEVLVEHVAETWPAGEERDAQAVRVGHRWGRSMVERGVATVDDAGTADLTASFATAGFDPETDGDEIRLRRCPVLALARRHQDVVCNAHLGMARELAGDATVDLVPFAEPGACLVHLRR